VLYEMLTGERAFTGETTTDILAAVVTKEPDLEKVPAQVRRPLRKGLEKDPKWRLRDIGEAPYLLDESAPLQPNGAVTVRDRLIAAGLAIIAVALGLIGWKHWHEEQPHVAKLFSPLSRTGTSRCACQAWLSPPTGGASRFRRRKKGSNRSGYASWTIRCRGS
jgi:hypothetical protein